MNTSANPWWRVGNWTNLKRFELLMYSSLYPAYAVPTMIVIVWMAGQRAAADVGAATFGLAMAALIACLSMGYRYLHRQFGGKPITRGDKILTASVFLIAAIIILTSDALVPELQVSGFLVILAQGLGLFAMVFKAYLVSLAGVALSLIVSLIDALVWEDFASFSSIFLAGTIISFLTAYTLRMSWWMIEVMRELDRARITQAELAVAEERLRFSRDLHDVFGRTLSVVSVKSELAAALAQRHDDRAVTEMLEVRTISAQALEEVREIVQGYREIDAMKELDGAAQLLRAAGVRSEFDAGGIEAWPTHARELLAWFIREGITNVVRHSRATWCKLEVEASAQRYRVIMMNDGASHLPDAAITSRGGTGLKGLQERITSHGGHIAWQQDPTAHTFTLEMTVPQTVAHT